MRWSAAVGGDVGLARDLEGDVVGGADDLGLRDLGASSFSGCVEGLDARSHGAGRLAEPGGGRGAQTRSRLPRSCGPSPAGMAAGRRHLQLRAARRRDAGRGGRGGCGATVPVLPSPLADDRSGNERDLPPLAGSRVSPAGAGSTTAPAYRYDEAQGRRAGLLGASISACRRCASEIDPAAGAAGQATPPGDLRISGELGGGVAAGEVGFS